MPFNVNKRGDVCDVRAILPCFPAVEAGHTILWRFNCHLVAASLPFGAVFVITLLSASIRLCVCKTWDSCLNSNNFLSCFLMPLELGLCEGIWHTKILCAFNVSSESIHGSRNYNSETVVIAALHSTISEKLVTACMITVGMAFEKINDNIWQVPSLTTASIENPFIDPLFKQHNTHKTTQSTLWNDDFTECVSYELGKWRIQNLTELV